MQRSNELLPTIAAAWVARIRRAAGEVVPPLGATLGAGEVDPYLLAAVHGQIVEDGGGSRWDCPAQGLGGVSSSGLAATLDPVEVVLWRLVHQERPPVERVLDPTADGPVLGSPMVQRPPRPIEVWTECELCALHALGRLAHGLRAGGVERPRAGPSALRSDEPARETLLPSRDPHSPRAPWPAQPDPRWVSRLDRARRWHLEHTQPDNATNRPWAVAVFALAQDPESQLYAQTLLHNCQVSASAQPEPLTAAILLDAAMQLEAIANRHR